MKSAEIQERKHLDQIKETITEAIDRLRLRLEKYERETDEEIEHYGSHASEMDHIEKANVRMSVDSRMMTYEQALENRRKLEKLKLSPYFGRFDFQARGRSNAEKFYIGIHNLYGDDDTRPVIFDWRAPVSSIFYEHESGPAQYDAPSGTIVGEVPLKRQFRIRDGEMEFMLESALNITDDVLQRELSRSSDDGMKNIVATIQRKQNAVIRNEQADVMIIQGVAGSGKTSIALHRIAFLLYRFKGTLTSDDILIISPNHVFADYISNVLPELGEQPVGEVQMETLARDLLGPGQAFQTFFEQTTELLEGTDEALRQRIEIKSSPDFLGVLDQYADHLKRNLFAGENVRINGYYVPDWLFDEVYENCRDRSREECIKRMSDIIGRKINDEFRITLNASGRAELKKKIGQMHKGVSLRKAYEGMFSWLGDESLFAARKDRKLEYADVFPMAYLKMRLERKSITPRDIKHLVIDEMQDYTPAQYAVIAELFPCNKTILGDAKQSVNPYSSSSGQVIQSFFPESLHVTLNRSYRSSYEIMRFVQKISANPELEPLERHGEEPRVIECEGRERELERIVGLTAEFLDSEHNTLGVICKTQTQAETLAGELKATGNSAHLLTEQSTTFDRGIIVCTAHMAKGLEFDRVIVPEVTRKNYSSTMDRNLLYVACTRAMHRLDLTYSGERSKLVAQCG